MGIAERADGRRDRFRSHRPFTVDQHIHLHKADQSETGIEDRSRVDFITPEDVPANVEDEIAAHLRNSFDRFDVVIVCDQAETAFGGVVTEKVRKYCMDLAAAAPERQSGWIPASASSISAA